MEDKLISIYKQLRKKVSTDKRFELLGVLTRYTLSEKNKFKLTEDDISYLKRIDDKIHQEMKTNGQTPIVKSLIDLLERHLSRIHDMDSKFVERRDGNFDLTNWDWEYGL